MKGWMHSATSYLVSLAVVLLGLAMWGSTVDLGVVTLGPSRFFGGVTLLAGALFLAAQVLADLRRQR